MENLPGSQSEAGANNDRDKKKDRQRASLSISSVLATPASAERAVEETTRKPIKLDRGLVELVVRKKLEDNKPLVESEPVDKPEREAELGSSYQPGEALYDTPHDVIETVSEEERKEYDEVLRDYALGANEFVGGEVVVSLHDPVEGRTVATEDRPEEPSRRTRPGLEPIRTSTERAPQFTSGENVGGAAPSGGSGEGTPPRSPETSQGTPDDQPPEDLTVRLAFEAERARLARGDMIYENSSSSHGEASPGPVPRTEGGITQEQLDDEVYYATKAGQNRGVAAGLAVAGYEHFKHKKREKKAEKRYQAQSKELDKVHQENKIHAEEQESQKREVERRLQTTERNLNTSEERFKKQTDQLRAEKQPVVIPEQVEADEPGIPAEHRVDTNSWLHTEIDKKTGKPVENQTFTRGEEYYRERAQENAPASQGTAAAEQAGTGVTGTQSAGSAPGSSSSLPPVGLPSASTQGPPPAQRQAPKISIRPKTASGQTAGPIWPWVVALLAIAISLALILR